ncbi:MAG: metal ABC transporter permease [Candidatus Yanofskybacteria bacterium]|nr:metal ABC transporter permease [Candidatus Yanofskybacteria bacterium]
MDINYLQIISAIFIGLASGYLGSFMVLKRMALVGDALSHVALPGVALALLFNINPFVGAFATLFAGIIGIWLIEHKTELPTESVVGLFFTFSLAVGLLITPEEELLEALFGDISTISGIDALLAVMLSLAVIFIMRSISKGFILGTISKDLAKTSNIKIARDNFIFMILVALIVALGIKSVGTLLMGALVIIPAIASKNIASNMNGYARTSAVIGLASLVGGVLFAVRFGLPPGPIVVLASTIVFLITLAFRR